MIHDDISASGGSPAEYAYGRGQVRPVPGSAGSAIPSIVWMYWSGRRAPGDCSGGGGGGGGGENPPLIRTCMEAIRRHNPHFAVHVLSPAELPRVLPDWFGPAARRDAAARLRPFMATHQRFSDFVRLQILRDHGGVWIDASVLLGGSLDWVHAVQRATGAEYVGYYIDKFTSKRLLCTSPVVENWFMACVPGSAFVAAWCDEFLRASGGHDAGAAEPGADALSAYVTDARERLQTDLQGIDSPYYLSMHVAAQVVLQGRRAPGEARRRYRLKLFKAEAGPFRHLHDHGWHIPASMEALLGGGGSRAAAQRPSYPYLSCHPVIKLRGSDRPHVTPDRLARLRQAMSLE